MFETLDTSKDGRLSKDELFAGYSQLMGAVQAELEVERIMTTVDVDRNGTIDYSEFISATINKTKLLTKERMKIAFDHFDKNKSGSINIQELKQLLDQGRHIDDSVWKAMIAEADINGDGEVSYNEFEKMMEGLINKAGSSSTSTA